MLHTYMEGLGRTPPRYENIRGTEKSDINTGVMGISFDADGVTAVSTGGVVGEDRSETVCVLEQ